MDKVKKEDFYVILLEITGGRVRNKRYHATTISFHESIDEKQLEYLLDDVYTTYSDKGGWYQFDPISKAKERFEILKNTQIQIKKERY